MPTVQTQPIGSADTCFCDSGVYARHCGPFHADEVVATTAGQLMRSCHSACVLDNTAYPRRMWHPFICPVDLEISGADAVTMRWLGPDVRCHIPQDAMHVTVEFVACYKVGDHVCHLHKTSRFVRLDASGAEFAEGRWLYVSGTFPD